MCHHVSLSPTHPVIHGGSQGKDIKAFVDSVPHLRAKSLAKLGDTLPGEAQTVIQGVTL